MARVLAVAMGVLLFVTAAVAWSQASEGMEDVVYLKDGSVLRGMIIEHIPSEALRIQIEGGNIFVIETDRICKVANIGAVRIGYVDIGTIIPDRIESDFRPSGDQTGLKADRA